MKQEAKILLGIGVATLAILFGAVFLLSKSTSPSDSSRTSIAANSPLLIKSDSHKIATDSAKVTVVEFGDYQCPACGQAYPVVEQVLKDYQGKINFVFRNFPLPQHQNAMIAAEAAEAAGAQNKYWDMYNKLYSQQQSWSDSNNPLGIFTGYAKDMGLDTAKFQSDVTSNKFSSRIQQDIADGNSLGVNSTPTFFINGGKLTGVPNYDDLKKILDTELK